MYAGVSVLEYNMNMAKNTQAKNKEIRVVIIFYNRLFFFPYILE